jgi:hypothetical protein
LVECTRLGSPAFRPSRRREGHGPRELEAQPGAAAAHSGRTRLALTVGSCNSGRKSSASSSQLFGLASSPSAFRSKNVRRSGAPGQERRTPRRTGCSRQGLGGCCREQIRRSAEQSRPHSASICRRGSANGQGEASAAADLAPVAGQWGESPRAKTTIFKRTKLPCHAARA